MIFNSEFDQHIHINDPVAIFLLMMCVKFYEKYRCRMNPNQRMENDMFKFSTIIASLIVWAANPVTVRIDRRAATIKPLFRHLCFRLMRMVTRSAAHTMSDAIIVEN